LKAGKSLPLNLKGGYWMNCFGGCGNNGLLILVIIIILLFADGSYGKNGCSCGNDCGCGNSGCGGCGCGC